MLMFCGVCTSLLTLNLMASVASFAHWPYYIYDSSSIINDGTTVQATHAASVLLLNLYLS